MHDDKGTAAVIHSLLEWALAALLVFGGLALLLAGSAIIWFVCAPLRGLDACLRWAVRHG